MNDLFIVILMNDMFDASYFLAVDLISHHLLQVNAGHRLAAANALRHAFFEDYQLYCDLRKLEDSCSCERWLTLDEDDDKWEQYAKDNCVSEKSSAESSLTLTLPTKNFLSVLSASKN
ncbi:unnamed protein product [Rotaria magnacalcarata]|uniref:Uncharacterized protein n=1 Tax=Rotaria magnacalcarata TaxID=392030 RepID=A0A8S3FU43_9BILA|nr:unnamed protein product [Rotaria magnacalcarata]